MALVNNETLCIFAITLYSKFILHAARSEVCFFTYLKGLLCHVGVTSLLYSGSIE